VSPSGSSACTLAMFVLSLTFSAIDTASLLASNHGASFTFVTLTTCDVVAVREPSLAWTVYVCCVSSS